MVFMILFLLNNLLFWYSWDPEGQFMPPPKKRCYVESYFEISSLFFSINVHTDSTWWQTVVDPNVIGF